MGGLGQWEAATSAQYRANYRTANESRTAQAATARRFARHVYVVLPISVGNFLLSKYVYVLELQIVVLQVWALPHRRKYAHSRINNDEISANVFTYHDTNLDVRGWLFESEKHIPVASALRRTLANLGNQIHEFYTFTRDKQIYHKIQRLTSR